MADPAMSTKTQSILAMDLGLQPKDYGTFTVKSGVTTMKPGMFVTTFGETGEDIDILTKEDEYATGVVISRNKRKISADGAVSDDIDTAFAAGDRVKVLLFTGGRAWVYVWLTGIETAAARGTMRRGAEVFIVQEDGTSLDIDNASPGAGLCFVKGTLSFVTITGNQHLVKIGMLLEDAIIADSTSAVAGVIAKVAI